MKERDFVIRWVGLERVLFFFCSCFVAKYLLTDTLSGNVNISSEPKMK